MKYPEYGEWCKKNIIETIKRQKIHSSKKYLDELVFNPDSDLYSTGVYDYEVCGILWMINDDFDDPRKSLFSAVQNVFAEEYFQMAQKINPEMDMKMIKRNGDYTGLMFRALENNITIEELKNAVMYAFEYGTEEIQASGIPYVQTTVGNIAGLIESGLVEVESVHINYLDPESERKVIPVNEFKDYLLHLNQSGIFSETVNWRYVDLFDSGNYGLECDIGHNNGYELYVAIKTKNKEDKNRVAEILKVEEQIK